MSDFSTQQQRSAQSGETSAKSHGPAEQASQQASELAGNVKQAAADAGEQLTITMEDQKRAGAQRLSHYAEAVVTAANQLDRNSPEFARYIREAAEQVQGFSEKLRTQNINELFNEFQSFAKRHPTAFLGATVLTGFALARFLKSAAGSHEGGNGAAHQHDASARSSEAPPAQRASAS